MYHEMMAPRQLCRDPISRGPIPYLFAVLAMTLFGLAIPPGAPAIAAQNCAGPGREAIVITDVKGWRNLTTDTGLQLTPAGIADFSALSMNPGTVADKAALAGQLDEAFKGLLGKPLRFEPVSKGTDRHGRHPVLLYSGDGLVQADLVARGLAVAYPAGQHLPCANRLFAAERLARADKAGFWALPLGWIAPPRPDAFTGRMSVFTILEGRVVSVGKRKSRTYLNFGGRWSSDVTVEIPARQRELLGGDGALDALSGKRIRVRGFPTEKSGPMFEVRQPWQIEQTQ